MPKKNFTADGVSVVIFEGAAPASPVELEMALVRRAALLDNLDKFRQAPEVSRLILATNDRRLAEQAAAAGAAVLLNDIPPASFHFGRQLKELVLEFGLERVFYVSGAGCPLIRVSEIRSICRRLLDSERLVYTNNTQSADLVAFNVTGDFGRAELPAMDNALATALRDQLGLEQELMPHSLGLLFDLDTPADVLVLGTGPFAGPRTREYLSALDWDYSRLEQAKGVLGDCYQEVALIGRVGAPVIEHLNATLKLRLRVFSEERGMKALGRLASGEVVSLLGFLLERAGMEDFFGYLSQVARCVFIDSRVLMAHNRFSISDRERFLSDLGRWQEIEHPWLREFTRQAASCDAPVLLGGHSLVSGSLWALAAELKARPA